MDQDFMFVCLLAINFVFMFVILLQVRENGKLTQKMKSLSDNQGDCFKELDHLALKVQSINTDLYKALLRPPVVAKAQPPRRGRPVGSKNKTKEGAKK